MRQSSKVCNDESQVVKDGDPVNNGRRINRIIGKFDLVLKYCTIINRDIEYGERISIKSHLEGKITKLRLLFTYYRGTGHIQQGYNAQTASRKAKKTY